MPPTINFGVSSRKIATSLESEILNLTQWRAAEQAIGNQMIWFLKNNQKDAWKNCDDFFLPWKCLAAKQNSPKSVNYFEFTFQLAINLRLDGIIQVKLTNNKQAILIHAKNVWCCREGYFGQKKIAEKVRKSRQKCVNRENR